MSQPTAATSAATSAATTAAIPLPTLPAAVARAMTAPPLPSAFVDMDMDTGAGSATPPPPREHAHDDALVRDDAPESFEPPRSLFATRPLRIAVIVGQVVSLPLAIASNAAPAFGIVALATAVVSVVALIAWSGLVTENVGRARGATTHHGPPSPIVAALSWLVAPVVAIPGLMLIYTLGRWLDEATYDEQSSRSWIFGLAVAVYAFVMLIAVYQPFRVLGRASKWVSGDASKFRRWFVAPFFAALLGAVLVALSSVTLATGDTQQGVADSRDYVAVGALIFASFLPWLAWVICASRAMVDLEEAVGHQHRRRTGEGLDVVMPMNPAMTVHVAAQPSTGALEI